MQDTRPVCGNEHEVWMDGQGRERARSTCDRPDGHTNHHEGWIGTSPNLRRVRWANAADTAPMPPEVIAEVEARLAELTATPEEQALLDSLYVLRNAICGHAIMVAPDRQVLMGTMAVVKGTGWRIEQGATIQQVGAVQASLRCPRCTQGA